VEIVRNNSAHISAGFPRNFNQQGAAISQELKGSLAKHFHG
jgi:hypothetical protein